MSVRTRGVLLLATMTVACGGGSGSGAGGPGGKGKGGGGVPVRVAAATRIDAPIRIDASGVVEPLQTVAVTAQVNGALESVDFTEGQFVNKGQVLFRIDPRPMQAQVEQASAALARDRAQAAAAMRNDERYASLVKQDYVTREQADQIHATAVAQQAIVASDEAALHAAQVNLGYATIRAPIAGRTGRLLVRAGNVVGPGSGPLVVINQLQPILARFPVLSSDLPAVQQALAQHPLSVTATKSDSGDVTETGTLSFIDNAIDSLTGTVTGKAQLPNAANRFWPGQLVFLSVNVGVQHNMLAIPQQAVLTGQNGSYVYVVNRQTMQVASRDIVAGRTINGYTIVTKGLGDGELVVIDGQSRLNPGAKVIITPPGGDSAETGGLHEVSSETAPGSQTGSASRAGVGGAAGANGAAGSATAATAGGRTGSGSAANAGGAATPNSNTGFVTGTAAGAATTGAATTGAAGANGAPTSSVNTGRVSSPNLSTPPRSAPTTSPPSARP